MTLNELRYYVNQVSYLDWTFKADYFGYDDVRDVPVGLYIQVKFCAKNNLDSSSAEQAWSGRKWHISSFATKDEVVQTCLKAVLTAVEHEAREQFKYRGVAIFQPHTPVDELVEIAKQKSIRS